MDEQNIDGLLQAARDPQQDLLPRIQALEQLASMQRPGLAPRLRELWDRPRPTGPKLIGWDNAAAERVVDLYIILALCKSGDLSLLPQISAIAAQSGDVLEGPDNERQNAAKVIRALGRMEPIDQLISLAGSSRPEAVTNAVRTLQLLDLPAPPSGGPISEFPELAVPVSFTIQRLKEELEKIASLSSGKIVLSEGAKEWIASHDSARGDVGREDTNLAEILTREIDFLGFAYAVTQRGVVICTFQEAGARWQQQWSTYSKRLVYDPGTQTWRSRPTPP